MNKNNLQLESMYRPEHLRRDFWLRSIDNGVVTFAKRIEFEERDISQSDYRNAFASVETDKAYPPELVAIFNGLWAMGLRPDGFEDRNRETGVLRDHLNDMRQLVFKDKLKAINVRI